MWISTTRLASLEGVTSQTIRRWIKQGKYETKITEGGHFRVNYKQKETTICYARVSSAKQRSSIDTQQSLLKEQYPDAEHVFDIGSVAPTKENTLLNNYLRYVSLIKL